MESLHVAIRALKGSKSRFCDIFARSSHVFRTLKVVSGEGYEGKMLKTQVFLSLRSIDRVIQR